jgi:hypothetical protein
MIDTPDPALSVPADAADTGTVNVPFAAAFPANVPVQFVPYVWPEVGKAMLFVGGVALYVNVIDGLYPRLPPESVDRAVTVYPCPLVSWADVNAKLHEPSPVAATHVGVVVVKPDPSK